MAYPEDLLEQAQHLAKRERKRPRQASLRRAVSSSYYALFHLLISETVRNWRRPQERFTLARMFEHGGMSKVCAKKRDDLRAYFGASVPPAPGPEFDRNRHLLNVAETFVEMLQHRQTADYDGAKVWSRVEVQERLDAVKEAFESWKSVRDHADAQNFLVTLLLRERRP
ncbi:MAG: hypothetical protein K2X03_29690 [Bryobacteraceae bacterium]|nr:hypothetical protein [Bryobacteraceae bacterium]